MSFLRQNNAPGNKAPNLKSGAPVAEFAAHQGHRTINEENGRKSAKKKIQGPTYHKLFDCSQ